MKITTNEFTNARAVLLATTGLASAAMISGVTAASAEGLYFGSAASQFVGDAPYENNASDADDYELDGRAASVFVGGKFMDVGGLTLGGEVSYTGFVNGDPRGNSDYADAYGINWMVDAKLRLGADVGKTFGMADGKLSAYGFAGVTGGTANSYWEFDGPSGYGFNGTNFGVGVEVAMQNNMFVGIEAIRRNVNTYNNEKTSNDAMSLRVGFKF